MPQIPVVPPITPLTGLDGLPQTLTDLPAANVAPVPPPQYFSPAVILPSLTTPLPTSPALPLQAVKLPHPPGAPLAVPCQTIVPNAPAAIPLLAVAPQGVAALSIHPAVAQIPAQIPAQPVYPAAFPQMAPADVPPSPHHTVQSLRATPPQLASPVPPQPVQPSVVHLPEQAAPTAASGTQVFTFGGGLEPLRARFKVFLSCFLHKAMAPVSTCTQGHEGPGRKAVLSCG